MSALSILSCPFQGRWLLISQVGSRVCVTTTFSYSLYLMLRNTLGPCWTLARMPISGQSQFLEMANWPRVCFSCANQPSQSLCPQPPPLKGSYTPGHSQLLCFNPPGLGTRQLGTASMLRSPLKSFKVTRPRSTSPASPLSSWGNHGTGSHMCFPLASPSAP